MFLARHAFPYMYSPIMVFSIPSIGSVYSSRASQKGRGAKRAISPGLQLKGGGDLQKGGTKGVIKNLFLYK
jgi:hypothetical protein